MADMYSCNCTIIIFCNLVIFCTLFNFVCCRPKFSHVFHIRYGERTKLKLHEIITYEIFSLRNITKLRYVTGSEKTDHFVIKQFVQYGPKALPRSRSRTSRHDVVRYLSLPSCRFRLSPKNFRAVPILQQRRRQTFFQPVRDHSGRNIRNTCAGAYVLCIVHMTS